MLISGCFFRYLRAGKKIKEGNKSTYLQRSVNKIFLEFNNIK